MRSPTHGPPPTSLVQQLSIQCTTSARGHLCVCVSTCSRCSRNRAGMRPDRAMRATTFRRVSLWGADARTRVRSPSLRSFASHESVPASPFGLLFRPIRLLPTAVREVPRVSFTHDAMPWVQCAALAHKMINLKASAPLRLHRNPRRSTTASGTHSRRRRPG